MNLIAMRDKWPPLPSQQKRELHGPTTTILVCNDRVEVRDEAARLLREEGYRVLTSADEKEILHLVEREPLDMVLMDIEILNRCGFALQERIREIRPILPVVHTSSSLHYRPI